MNNHPNEWREIGLALNTHVLKLCLIKPPSVQAKAETCHHSKARELAALVHGLICSLFGHFRCSGAFSPSPLVTYPLKAELESLGLVFLSLLTCSQWLHLQLEERSCTRLLGLLPGPCLSWENMSRILRTSVSPSPTDMSNNFLHAVTVFIKAETVCQ